MFFPFRENGSCNSGGDSAAGDRSERGAFSLPESPDRTPSPGGEVRRPQGDGSFFGEEHVNTDEHREQSVTFVQLHLNFLCPEKASMGYIMSLCIFPDLHHQTDGWLCSLPNCTLNLQTHQRECESIALKI